MLVAAPYLNHRCVGTSLALTIGPDGALYVTMGNAGHVRLLSMLLAAY